MTATTSRRRAVSHLLACPRDTAGAQCRVALHRRRCNTGEVEKPTAVNRLNHAMARSYTIIDHTADIGILVTGADPADLFRNAALAMFDLIAGEDHRRADLYRTLTVEGSDWPDLMVNWLRELLYLWSGEDLLVASIDIRHIAERAITAEAAVERFQPERHRIHNEIKAVTYHQIDVSESLTGWEAKIILDV